MALEPSFVFILMVPRVNPSIVFPPNAPQNKKYASYRIENERMITVGKQKIMQFQHRLTDLPLRQT